MAAGDPGRLPAGAPHQVGQGHTTVGRRHDEPQPPGALIPVTRIAARGAVARRARVGPGARAGDP